MNHFDSQMEIATVRDLRTSFPRIEKILESGESVEIRKRNKVVAILTPPAGKQKIQMPDFAARMQKIFPDMKNRGIVEALIEERDS
jgi:antitoxin (DNA-binding transcriptional repressor) of toxin-antitoxin stability system